MENKEYGAAAGSPDAPYLNGLARRSAVAESYFAVTHPSLPNYLALIGGDTFGITSDCTGCHVSARNVVDQLKAAGITWKAYMDGVPRPCFTGSSAGRYAKKHNPFVYFDDITGDRARCARIVPMTELPADERSGLPQFVWITPDLCHDTHDCPGRTGDDFLSQLLPPLIAALGPGGVVLVTYDEGTTRSGCCSYAHGGRVFTIAAGPGVRSGRYAQRFDHYSLLRTIEERFGLGYLARAGSASTKSMSPMLR